MNKTVTINIGGFVFHIEDQAYEKLKNYLDTIEGYFADTDGREEIMGDIEARIAEIFNGKVNEAKEVITLTDVNEAIEVMGQPEAYIDEEEEPRKAKRNYQFTGGRKRVFRDPDNAIVGGVCGGLGAYFNIDPLWFRLAVVVFTLVFLGTGAFLYIVLWIIIPEARTTAEKLMMRGETVNVGNIERTIREEIDQIKDHINDMSEDAKNWSKGTQGRRTHNFIHKVVDTFSRIVITTFKILGKAIGVFLIIIGIILLASFIGSFFGLPNTIKIDQHGISTFSFFGNNFLAFLGSPSQVTIGIIGIILFFGIPLVAMIYAGMRILFKFPFRSKIIGITLASLWGLGVIFSIIVGIQIGRDFAVKSTNKDDIAIAAPEEGKTLYLTLSKNNEGIEDYINQDDDMDWLFITNDEGNVIYNQPDFDIRPSETDKFHLEVIKSSRGSAKKEAYYRAQNIEYNFQQKDSILEFGKFYMASRIDYWRGQEVKLVLRVPVGGTVYLGKDMKEIIYDIKNVTNTHDIDMPGRRWKMTVDGLACVDCEGIVDYSGRAPKPIPQPATTPPPAPLPDVEDVSWQEDKEDDNWIPIDGDFSDMHKHDKSKEQFDYEMKKKLNEIIFEMRNTSKGSSS